MIIINVDIRAIEYYFDSFDFVFVDSICDIELLDENDLMKSKTCRNFPKN